MNDTTQAGPKHAAEPDSRVAEGRKRLLITGSRDWPNQPAIAAAILQQWHEWGRPPMTIVHGGAKGADTMAEESLSGDLLERGYLRVEVHHAEWEIHGRAAGPIRNAQMVALGADACLAFIHNGSRGATGCVALAEGANIPVTVYRLDSHG